MVWFEGSMTLDEMRQQLQMGKPSMSTGVKTTRIRYRQTTIHAW